MKTLSWHSLNPYKTFKVNKTAMKFRNIPLSARQTSQMSQHSELSSLNDKHHNINLNINNKRQITTNVIVFLHKNDKRQKCHNVRSYLPMALLVSSRSTRPFTGNNLWQNEEIMAIYARELLMQPIMRIALRIKLVPSRHKLITVS